MQRIIYTVLTPIIAFVCIIVCIQEFCYLSISDRLLSMLSEWEMTWPYDIPALSAGNWRHVDHITSFGKYSSTSSPFLILLLLLNFHDVPQAISNISTMCTRSVWRVMQLDTWMNLALRSSLRSIQHAHRPLFPWHVWHHSLELC